MERVEMLTARPVAAKRPRNVYASVTRLKAAARGRNPRGGEARRRSRRRAKFDAALPGGRVPLVHCRERTTGEGDARVTGCRQGRVRLHSNMPGRFRLEAADGRQKQDGRDWPRGTVLTGAVVGELAAVAARFEIAVGVASARVPTTLHHVLPVAV